jgi:hypothetical protein
VLDGSSLMSSAWRATGVISPVASASVTVMWSVLNAWADVAGGYFRFSTTTRPSAFMYTRYLFPSLHVAA